MNMNVVRILPLLLVLTGGCATAPGVVPTATDLPQAACQELFRQLDNAVGETGVGDAQAVSVHGFPYLRTDRFLTSFRDAPLTRDQQHAWVARMRTLDQEARRAEIANLPAAQQKTLREALPGGLAREPDLPTVADKCGTTLMERDLAQPATLDLLRENLHVPPEYDALMRVAGLYYLSAWPIKMGVVKLHREIHHTYAHPLDELPLLGRLMRYDPPPGAKKVTPEEVQAILERAYRKDPLGIPHLDGTDRERLFQAFAPTFEVDTASVNDLVGAPWWPSASAATPAVEPVRPTVYRHLSHTRWQGRILPQLTYIVWFPARPPLSPTDILAGALDGIMWRVTLSPQGRPLVYDTAHNCGCYHLFFPTAGVTVKPEPELLQEPAFAPQQAPELTAGEGARLRIAAVSHFVDRVSPPDHTPWNGIRHAYHWEEYDTLRSLPVAGGERRSLFRPDGIVPGTERGERWILWPMGVPNPGEMRQWGHHATAFFGHRHFDDPDLMERSLLVGDGLIR